MTGHMRNPRSKDGIRSQLRQQMEENRRVRLYEEQDIQNKNPFNNENQIRTSGVISE